MASQQQLTSHWDEVKACLQKRWGHLTDDELEQVRGDRMGLLSALEARTGLSRNEIQDFLNEAIGNPASAMGRIADTARDYAAQTGDMVRQGSDQAAQNVRAGYRVAQRSVRRHPTESMSIAFLAGAAAGVALALLARREGCTFLR